jgi:dolichol-phosphate mannosyltransferase
MARLSEHAWTVDAGDFAVFNRRVHEAMLRLPENQQVPRGLRSWVGFRQTSHSYQRPPRRHGRSKYNVLRLTFLAISSIVNFSTAPLRLATIVGASMAVLTLVAALLFTLNRFFPQLRFLGYNVGENAGTTTIVLYLSFIASVLFFCLGVMGEYLAVILKEVKARPIAMVAETTGDGPSGAADAGDSTS